MIAYKGFSKDIKSILGNGKEETCRFKQGVTMKEKISKTGLSGYHCCENPFECLTYYPMDGLNRFFRVEAAGNIDEDDSERIACTEITLIEELDEKKFALYGMIYMIEHPEREKWRQEHGTVVVREDVAEAKKKGHIAIARGKNPKVKGPEGSILGLLIEDGKKIKEAKLFIPEKKHANKWMHLGSSRKIEEVVDEKEDD